MKKLVGAAAALLLATSMSFAQSESSIEFTIPYADATQQAEVEAMGGSAVNGLAEGSYTLVSSKQSSAQNLSSNSPKNSSKAFGPLVVDCSNIVDTPLSCRADLPPVDFDLPVVVDSMGSIILSALTIIPGNSGCPGDPVIISRTYFINDGVSTEDCMQTFTVLSMNGPALVCPADVTLDCFTDDTTPANTGMATATQECTFGTGSTTLAPTFTDVSTEGAPGTPEAWDYVITRTWSVTDGCGRTATCDQIITVASTRDCLLDNGIPTMGQWALFILALMMSSLAIVFIKRKSIAKA